MTPAELSDPERRVLDAMRNREWLRTQWIARVAFNAGRGDVQSVLQRTRYALKKLERVGKIERRDSSETRRRAASGIHVEFEIPRSEWRPQDGGKPMSHHDRDCAAEVFDSGLRLATPPDTEAADEPCDREDRA